MRGFTAKPAGTQSSDARMDSYSATQSAARSGSMNWNDRAPMPQRAASRMVSRRLQATHSGGWGFWRGLGTTLRGGICSHLPSQPANGVSTIMRDRASTWSVHWSRLVSQSTPKPPSSARDDASPVPRSTRPPDRRSSVAARSATLAVWLNSSGNCTMPCPRRMRSVTAATAPRNTSGAAEWLYSSRKWCSTSHT